MKKFLIINLVIILTLIILLPISYATLETKIVDENGNPPSYKYYTHVNSRAIRTLKQYDGKIFMGLGDWNDNTGPVKIIYYDTTDNQIKTSGTIPDEAVQDFTIIDNKLYTTGCDPRASWGYGSYYIYNKETNKWEQHQKQRGWVHVFHVTEFKNKLFMSGEIDGKKSTEFSPIQYSEDNGETFINTKIFNGTTDITHYADFRCLNLVPYSGKLYAYFRYHDSTNKTYNGIYLYDETNNQFNYYSDLPSSNGSPYVYSSQAYYNMKNFNHEIFNNEFIYVSGTSLYKTTDLKTFDKVPTNTKDVVQDVVIYSDTLYALSYAYDSNNGMFTVRIYCTKDLKNFHLMDEFTSETVPTAIEYYDKNIYVGTGSITDKNSTSKSASVTGTLYKVDISNVNINFDVDTNINTNTNTNNNTNTNTNTNANINNTVGTNNNSSIVTNSTQETNTRPNTNKDSNNSQVDAFINSNSKLPQTGNFFTVERFLKLLIVSAVLLISIMLKRKNT